MKGVNLAGKKKERKKKTLHKSMTLRVILWKVNLRRTRHDIGNASSSL